MKKTFSIDFINELWIRDLKIEAESEEEAKEILYRMSIDEMFDNDAYIKDHEIKSVDIKLDKGVYKVQCTGIKWSTDVAELLDNELSTGQEILSKLPKTAVVYVESDLDDEDVIFDLAVDELSYKYDWLVDDIDSIEYKLV